MENESYFSPTNNTIQRKIDFYKIEVVGLNDKKDPIPLKNNFPSFKENLLNDFFNYYFKNNTATDLNIGSEKQFTVNSSRKFIFAKFNPFSNEQMNSASDNIFGIQMEYVNHNKNIEIVDTVSWDVLKNKQKTEGDKLKQHFLIKTLSNEFKALFLFEKINEAVPISVLRNQFEKAFFNYILEKHKDCCCGYNYNQLRKKIEFNFKIAITHNIEEKIEDLSNGISSISIFEITPHEDPDLYFKDTNLRTTREITFKPKLKKKFKKEAVINYFRRVFKSEKIERIVIKGFNAKKQSLIINSEGFKYSNTINVSCENTNLINTQDMLKQLSEISDLSSKDLELIFKFELDSL